MKSGPNTASRMILKELGIDKGSGYAALDKKGNISIEQLIKIAKAKIDDVNSYTLKNAVKEIAGACVPMGILCEGMTAKEFAEKVDEGIYDDEINNEKTTVSDEKKKELQEQLKLAQSKTAQEFESLQKKLESKMQKEASKAAKIAKVKAPAVKK